MSILYVALNVAALFFVVMVPLLIWSDTREIRREVLALRKEVAFLQSQIKVIKPTPTTPSRSIFAPLADEPVLHKGDGFHQL